MANQQKGDLEMANLMHQILKQEKLFVKYINTFHKLHPQNHNAQQDDLTFKIEKGTLHLDF